MSEHYEIGVQILLFLGVLAIGIALGSAVGLSIHQQTCTAAGQLPAPGSVVLPGQLDGNACWQGALQLQHLANITGGIGAVLLLLGGLADTYDERVREVLGV